MVFFFVLLFGDIFELLVDIFHMFNAINAIPICRFTFSLLRTVNRVKPK